MGSLDVKVKENGKNQQTALERKGFTCTSTCGWSKPWLGGYISHFALASYSLYCAILIFFLWPKAVYSIDCLRNSDFPSQLPVFVLPLVRASWY